MYFVVDTELIKIVLEPKQKKTKNNKNNYQIETLLLRNVTGHSPESLESVPKKSHHIINMSLHYLAKCFAPFLTAGADVLK